MSQLSVLYDRGISLLAVHKAGPVIAIEATNTTRFKLHKSADGYVVVRDSSHGQRGARRVNLNGVVYVAGPMRGIPHHNFPAFDIASAGLQTLGYYVFNPADFDRQMGLNEDTTDEDVTPQILRDCLDRDLNAICRCTHIALLPGWESSRGVRPEAILAKTLGLEFLTVQGENVTEGVDLDIETVDGTAVCAVIGARMVGEYRDKAENN